MTNLKEVDENGGLAPKEEKFVRSGGRRRYVVNSIFLAQQRPNCEKKEKE